MHPDDDDGLGAIRAIVFVLKGVAAIVLFALIWHLVASWELIR